MAKRRTDCSAASRPIWWSARRCRCCCCGRRATT